MICRHCNRDVPVEEIARAPIRHEHVQVLSSQHFKTKEILYHEVAPASRCFKYQEYYYAYAADHTLFYHVTTMLSLTATDERRHLEAVRLWVTRLMLDEEAFAIYTFLKYDLPTTELFTRLAIIFELPMFWLE